MVKDYSPFTPGVPVPIDFFFGREEEIKEILGSVEKSLARNTIERLFVAGDRGIGKSSICNFALHVAEKDLEVIGLHVYMGGVDTLEEMVRRVFEGFLKASIDKPWYSKVKEFLGDHVEQVGLFGVSVKFSASKTELEYAVNNFLPALQNLLKKLSPEKKGILIILDDINGLASSSRFANWLKSFVDECATSRTPIPVSLVLVGLPERRNEMIKSQPSLDRVFDIIKIEKFRKQETKEFFSENFNKVEVRVDPKALDLLTRWSAGFPVFMHELGDATYKEDTDNTIDGYDAMNGVLRGTDTIGAKYIESKVMSAIRSKKYKGILKKIPRKPLGYRFSRQEAVSVLKSEEAKVFDTFIYKMKKLGVIVEDKDLGSGNYEFSSELYHLFFWLKSELS